jgi:hypothetical protein
MGDFTLNGVTRIEGVVAEADTDTLGMVARWLYPRVGRKFDAMYGSYHVPLADIERLEEWRFAGKRTVLAVGVGAVVTALVLNAVWRVVRGPRDGDVIPPETQIVAPR